MDNFEYTVETEKTFDAAVAAVEAACAAKSFRVLHVHGSKHFISAFRPVAIKEMLPEAGLDRLADEVDAIICGIVDAAK
jgi:hypothetical protein